METMKYNSNLPKDIIPRKKSFKKYLVFFKLGYILCFRKLNCLQWSNLWRDFNHKQSRAVWGCIHHHGAVWGCIHHPGAVWGCIHHPGAVWGVFTTLVQYGGVSTTVVQYGGVSTTLVQYWGVSTTLVQYGGVSTNPGEIKYVIHP